MAETCASCAGKSVSNLLVSNLVVSLDIILPLHIASGSFIIDLHLMQAGWCYFHHDCWHLFAQIMKCYLINILLNETDHHKECILVQLYFG